MFVSPASGAYASPNLHLFRPDDVHTDMPLVFHCRLLNRKIKDAAKLDRSIVALAQQVHRSDPSKRAQFMDGRGSAVEKKALNHVQRFRPQFLEDSESKTLSNGGVDAIEDCECPSALDPLSAAIGDQTTLCLSELNARVPLRKLQRFESARSENSIAWIRLHS